MTQESNTHVMSAVEEFNSSRLRVRMLCLVYVCTSQRFTPCASIYLTHTSTVSGLIDRIRIDLERHSGAGHILLRSGTVPTNIARMALLGYNVGSVTVERMVRAEGQNGFGRNGTGYWPPLLGVTRESHDR